MLVGARLASVGPPFKQPAPPLRVPAHLPPRASVVSGPAVPPRRSATLRTVRTGAEPRGSARNRAETRPSERPLRGLQGPSSPRTLPLKERMLHGVAFPLQFGGELVFAGR